MTADDDLTRMTADRDEWKKTALRRQRQMREAETARRDFMTELARYVVTEMRSAGYIQINPEGAPSHER